MLLLLRIKSKIPRKWFEGSLWIFAKNICKVAFVFFVYLLLLFVLCASSLSLCLKKSIKFVGITLPSHLFNFFLIEILWHHCCGFTFVIGITHCGWTNVKEGLNCEGPQSPKSCDSRLKSSMVCCPYPLVSSGLGCSWHLDVRCENGVKRCKSEKKTTFLVLTCPCSLLQSSRRSACWSDSSWIQKNWVSAFS